MKSRFAVVAMSGLAWLAPLGAQTARTPVTPQFRVHIIDRNFEGITGGGISQTALADLDGDGRPEFVMGRSNGPVLAYKYETPEKWTRFVIGQSSPSDAGGGVTDVDRDGKIDVVTGGAWYRNSGSLSTPFERIVFDETIFGGIHDIQIGDIDKDGRDDVVTMSDRNNVRWYKIPDDPRQPWIKTDIGPPVHAGIGLGDLNGDGHIDIARTDVWYENFVPPPPAPRGGGPGRQGGGAAAAVARPLAAPQAPAIGQAPQGSAPPAPGPPAGQSAGAGGRGGRGAAMAPVQPGSRWLVHALGYVPAPPAGQPSWANWATRSVIADINGDGRNDVVQGDAEFAGGKVWWMENKDGRTWMRHDLSPSDRKYGAWHSLIVRDFTGDGRPDVFASEMDWQRARGDQNPKHYIFENAGTAAAWKTHVVADLNLGGHEPVAGDVTGDGCVDIVTKPWSPSPNNAVGGSPYVLFMHNVSAGCK